MVGEWNLRCRRESTDTSLENRCMTWFLSSFHSHPIWSLISVVYCKYIRTYLRIIVLLEGGILYQLSQNLNPLRDYSILILIQSIGLRRILWSCRQWYLRWRQTPMTCVASQCLSLAASITAALITGRSGCAVTQILNAPHLPLTLRRCWTFHSNCTWQIVLIFCHGSNLHKYGLFYL